jgi:hypothetical protein
VKLLLPIINLEFVVYNVGCEADPMSKTPFILQFGQSSTTNRLVIDSVTSEDPLPAVLVTTTDGYAMDRGTRVTAVEHETTDDK